MQLPRCPLILIPLILTLLVMAKPATLVAEMRPDEFLEKLIKRAQSLNSIEPFYDHLDYEKQLATFPPALRQAYGITDTASLKEFSLRYVRDPDLVKSEKFLVPQIDTAKGTQQEILLESAAEAERMLIGIVKVTKNNFPKTKFRVHPTEVKDGTATVDVSGTIEGFPRKASVELRKSADGSWLIDSLDFLFQVTGGAPLEEDFENQGESKGLGELGNDLF